MARILKRPQAQTDLDEIWLYIAQENPEKADAFLDEIEKRCRALAQSPFIGTSPDEIMAGLRSLAVASYLIFYLPIEGGIDVVRVLHGMRDIDVLF
ncbi:MAG: type II toxin-antitoxin system RelE/ParE family toxin [Syntrophobacteraceae bacterium]|nr:type II toxin-antitoxin system RelE/ParE family toxin [Syntrophobacteraceae bacterium]